MFCHNCGKQQEDDAIFCQECGTRLNEDMEIPGMNMPGYDLPDDPYSIYNSAEEKETRGFSGPVQEPDEDGGQGIDTAKRKKLIIGGVSAAVIVICLAAVILVAGRNRLSKKSSGEISTGLNSGNKSDTITGQTTSKTDKTGSAAQDSQGTGAVVPETTAPETKAPETTAPETKAPQTTAPETKASQTTAPETTAPQTTAPETSAPQTQTPETQNQTIPVLDVPEDTVDVPVPPATSETPAATSETPETIQAVEGDSSLYNDGTVVPTGSYILPDSATRYLTESDLSNLTLKGLCYAKNEIYARYGRKFKSAELTQYFSKQPWYSAVYEPTDENDAMIVSKMNEYERQNKDLIWQAEQKLGPYSLDTEPVVSSSSSQQASEAGIHKYEVFLKDVTWEQAFNDCIQKGGHLIRFNSQEEYNYLWQELERLDCKEYRFYIGGRRNLDSQQYFWAANDNTLYGDVLNSADVWCSSNWMKNEPSFRDETIGQDEHVMELFFYKDENRWVWNDIPNNLPDYISGGKIGYICEYE